MEVHMDGGIRSGQDVLKACLLYTSDAADERSSVDLGGRRIIKKKNNKKERGSRKSLEKRAECSLAVSSTQVTSKQMY